MTNTFVAAAKVQVAPGHTPLVLINELNIHTLSRLYLFNQNRDGEEIAKEM